MDDGTLGETRNGDKAWRMYDRHADWHVVLQDDAILCDQFTIHLRRALEFAPETVVSLYVGTGRPQQKRVEKAVRQADVVRSAWLMAPALFWGVAVAMPTRLVSPFLLWGQMSANEAYDRRIGSFITRRNQQVWYTWPSLVDHADGPTLLQHQWGAPTMDRRAWRVGPAPDYRTRAVRI
jgi:hypothetical protein